MNFKFKVGDLVQHKNFKTIYSIDSINTYQGFYSVTNLLNKFQTALLFQNEGLFILKEIKSRNNHPLTNIFK